MSAPQLIITLAPNSSPVIELPGSNGSRRKIPLNPNGNFSIPIQNAIEALEAFQNIELVRQEYNIAASKTTNKGSKEEKHKLMLERQLETLKIKTSEASLVIAALNTILNTNETVLGIITNILSAQTNNKVKIGEDGNPTPQQVNHWEKHCHYSTAEKAMVPNLFGDPTCAFCRAEGRFEPGYNREDNRKIRGLSLNEALRLGLLARGFQASKNNPDIYLKPNTKLVARISNNKVLDGKSVIWSKTQTEALIEDGKNHAKRVGFIPRDTKPSIKRAGVTVRTIVEKPPQKKHDPIKIKDLSY